MVFNRLKFGLLAAFLVTGIAGFSQGGDSLQAGTALKLIGLDFTPAELDSMQDELKQSRKTYTRMRELPTGNALAYPFAFDPAPPGFRMPVKQDKVSWNIPADVTLPANKNELAFYSITQLASLIKNKKISSVELTGFFLDRLQRTQLRGRFR